MCSTQYICDIFCRAHSEAESILPPHYDWLHLRCLSDFVSVSKREYKKRTLHDEILGNTAPNLLFQYLQSRPSSLPHIRHTDV